MHLAILTLVMLFNASAAVVNSDDLDTAFKTIQKLDPQKQAAEVKPLAMKVFTIAQQILADPAPEGGIEKENWQKRVTWIHEVQLFTEYVVSTAAFTSSPAMTVDLISMLEFQSPKSRYLDTAYPRYLYALHQTGAGSKIPAVAEKAIAHFPENEDLLLVLSDNALDRKNTAAALNYSQRLVTVLNKHPKPEGMAQADWDRKKSAALGRGYWISGIVQGERNQYGDSDRNLRAALPLIKGNDAMSAAAYYYLGLDNYQIGKMTLNKAMVLEGVKFSETAARYGGAYQQNAYHNVQVMKGEAARMR